MNRNDNTDTLAAADLFGPTLVELVTGILQEGAARDGARATSALAHRDAARKLAFDARLAAAQAPTNYDTHMQTADYYNGQATEAAAEATHWRRAANAAANALTYWLQGWRPTPLPRGGWTIRSQRPGEAAHVLTPDADRVLTCSCRSRSEAHWALALVVAIEEAQEALETLDGPDDAPGDPWPPDEAVVAPWDEADWPIAPPATIPVDAWVWN